MNYRHYITIQNDTSADGQIVPTYEKFLANVPCNIKPVGGGERYRGNQLLATTRYVIETRYNDEFKHDMRAVNEETNAEYYFSRMIDHEGRQRVWLIEATEAHES